MIRITNQGEHSDMAKKKEIDLEEMNIILRVPKDAVTLTVNAAIMNSDDKPVKVKKRLTTQDVYKARQDFLDNVEDGDDYDARFVITEEGRRYLEELERQQRGREAGAFNDF